MIQMQTRLSVADNTGAKEVMCFKVLGGSRRRYAGLGDIVVCSVKTVISGSLIPKSRKIASYFGNTKTVTSQMTLTTTLTIISRYGPVSEGWPMSRTTDR